jgi:hypothetical protein
LIVFTAASSLGTSSSTATDSLSTKVGSLQSRQNSVVSWHAVVFIHQALISAIIFIRSVSILFWLASIWELGEPNRAFISSWLDVMHHGFKPSNGGYQMFHYLFHFCNMAV